MNKILHSSSSSQVHIESSEENFLTATSISLGLTCPLCVISPGLPIPKSSPGYLLLTDFFLLIVVVW